MRITPISISWLFFGITALLPTIALSDTALDDPSSRLIVTVYEYRAEIAPSPGASPSEIVAQLLEGDAKPIRTIRLPTLSDCMAHFSASERIYVSQRSSNGEGDRDEPNPLEIGTILQVTAKRTSASVLMDFNYTTSSLTTEDVAGSSPRVKESTVQGTYSFQLGEPVLVGGLTASDGFYLVATVTEPSPGRQAKD